MLFDPRDTDVISAAIFDEALAMLVRQLERQKYGARQRTPAPSDRIRVPRAADTVFWAEARACAAQETGPP